MNQTTRNAIFQLILRYILFCLHIWSCLNTELHRLHKTMLFCVVYIRKNFVLSGCQCSFSFILVVNHRNSCDTYYKAVRFNFSVFCIAPRLDILVSKVFRIKPTLFKHSLCKRVKEIVNTTLKTN